MTLFFKLNQSASEVVWLLCADNQPQRESTGKLLETNHQYDVLYNGKTSGVNDAFLQSISFKRAEWEYIIQEIQSSYKIEDILIYSEKLPVPVAPYTQMSRLALSRL